MRMEGLRYKVFNNLVLVFAILPFLAEGQVQFGRCSNEPCLNDGECRGIFRLFYACSCTDGYTGSNCQYERPCNTFPCLNGGSCTDDLDNSSRECTCPPNVSGESCEFVRECVDDDVRCNGYCFPSIIRCDYNADCPDETDEEGCNEIDITPDGVNLTSPYFPGPGYLDNFDYTWYLTSPEDHYISLNFSVFDLEYYHDVIFIGEGEDNSYDNADYKLTGEYEVLRILPKSSSIWIRMVTDDYRSPSIGFKVYANAVPIAEAVLRECDPETEFSCKDGSCLGATVVCDGFNQCSNEADEYSCPRTTCYGGAYIPEYERCNRHWFCPEGEDEYYCEPAQVGEVFYMETPIDIDRPTGYKAYSNETWTVATEEGLCLSVYFSSFKTESDYDLWYIGVGNKLSISAVFLYLSGTYVPEPFLLPINETFVHFESDGSKNDGYVLMELEVVNKTELMYCEKGSYVHRKQICDNEWHCLDGRDEEMCEPLPRGENRIITSAYYPIGYPKNTYQVWTFTTEDDLKLMLHVTTLRTEENFDLLRIGSGSSCVEESYASFSGEMDNQFVISQDNTMCVFFSSDYSVGNIGMTATVSAVAENDYVTCSSDGSVIPAFLQCDFRWNCPAGEDERGCEPLKLYDAIPFQSPNFPGAYPPYSYIIYTASSEPGTETYYTFDIFDMEKGIDYLYAGCGPDPFDANTTVVSLTGYEVEPFTLPCNDVWFTLYSDGHGYNIGYSGTTYVVPASDGLVCSEDGSPVDKDAVCDSKWDCLLTGDDERNCPRIPVNQTAYIQSENYPAPYPRDQFTVFTGEAEDGLHAVVEFFDFDLQAGDSLTFGCGANPYDDLSVVATFTGGEIPRPLTIECASIWFSLSTTSSEGDNRGYFGSITTVAPDEGLICSDRTFVPDDRICDGRWECKDEGEDESDCPLIPVDQTVFFESENYPSPYPTDDFFIYSGEAEAELSAVVEFLDFDVEDGKDFLTFGCGKDPYDKSSIVATFTGELPPSLIIDCQQIWFTLETDSSEGNNRGYFGSITTVRRIVDPEPPELVAGRCTDYLPYSETVSETKFPLKLPLGREVIRDLIMGPACDDDEVLRGICAILYPPLKADTEQGEVDVCSSTCEKFHLCSSIDLLVDVDCDFVSSETPHDGLPGLCYEDEKED